MHTRKKDSSYWPLTRRICGAVAIALLAGLASAAHAGDCATASLPWPIVLPDGSTSQDARLTVCMDRYLNPATGLHELRVGARAIGLFMSRVGKSEGPAGDSVVVVFGRDAANRYHLIGYARPRNGTLETFALYDPTTLRKQGRGIEVAELRLESDNAILVAANKAK